jgi:hypothetical protein
MLEFYMQLNTHNLQTIVRMYSKQQYKEGVDGSGKKQQ